MALIVNMIIYNLHIFKRKNDGHSILEQGVRCFQGSLSASNRDRNRNQEIIRLLRIEIEKRFIEATRKSIQRIVTP